MAAVFVSSVTRLSTAMALNMSITKVFVFHKQISYWYYIKEKHVTGNHGIEYAGLIGPWLFGVFCELFWEKSLKRNALQCHR